MTEQAQTIAAFWNVFNEQKSVLATLSTADHPVYDLLLDRLHEINAALYFEFSSNGDSTVLIITAEGDSSLFSLVDVIVHSAPKISGWTIHSLKPQLGFPTDVSWEGFHITPTEIQFDPLERADSTDLGIRIYVPGLQEEDIESAHNAILRALDHGLGERAFAKSIYYTDVYPLPSTASDGDFIPLVEIEGFIEWRNKKRSESRER